MNLSVDNLSTLVSIWLAICCSLLVEGCSEKEVGRDMNDQNEQKTATEMANEGIKTEACKEATFAAGCFWGVEAAFGQVKGVVSTAVGYTGGHFENPTYRDVCSHSTGHAEAVQVIYDPKQVSYEQLLEVFWNIHNPTTPNRQGPDVGSQYRSAIFYHSESQRKAAEASKESLENSRRFRRPIVTQITPASVFYRAEEYHQRYLEKQGRASCHLP
jgi:peptide-methionine (S)-S-oxide reductase